MCRVDGYKREMLQGYREIEDKVEGRARCEVSVNHSSQDLLNVFVCGAGGSGGVMLSCTADPICLDW